jgi:hypothetical protein
MACGVTTTLLGATATCDNAGTSAHAGNHSGTINASITVMGITWTTSARIWWRTGVTVPVKQKTATLGESDFV